MGISAVKNQKIRVDELKMIWSLKYLLMVLIGKSCKQAKPVNFSNIAADIIITVFQTITFSGKVWLPNISLICFKIVIVAATIPTKIITVINKF